MKRIFLFFSVLLMLFGLGACSRQAADNAFSCLAFQRNGSDVSAFPLTVDAKQHTLTIDSEALYRLTPPDNSTSSIVPLLQTEKRLVLRTQPAAMPEAMDVVLADPNALYHAADTLLQGSDGPT